MAAQPPYYAVIFSSTLKEPAVGYSETAERMVELAKTMPGFLGIESVRGADGFGITVSYWCDEAAIAAWRDHAEHKFTQQRGNREWYKHFNLRVAKVEREYTGPR